MAMFWGECLDPRHLVTELGEPEGYVALGRPQIEDPQRSIEV